MSSAQDMKFSVLMSVYKKEKAEYLRESLASVYGQTLLADEVILVEDGPLTAELYELIEEEKSLHSNLITVVLPKNQGLGLALREGIQHCKHEFVARMDTDDVCKPERFAKEVAYLTANPDVSVVGSWIDEFETSPEEVVTVRKVPEDSDEIYKFAKKRNPLNHPTVMFRKSEVLKAGSYVSFPLFEDYYLWVRMLQRGCKFHNIQESLLYFRRSPMMFRRRGGVEYMKKELNFQKALLHLQFIGLSTFIYNCFVRFSFRLIPNSLRRWCYSKIIRDEK